MAKLTLPLGSSAASGQLGKSWVFFTWKGLNLVRTLVIPANPKTADQVTQRGYFTAAVAAYHATAYTADDIGGWRRFALQLSAVMTYFNAIVRQMILCAVATDTWENCWNVRTSLPIPGGFTVKVETAVDRTALIYWGTSPGFMPTPVAAPWGAGPPAEYTCALAGLPSNVQIYYYLTVTAPGFQSRTGIHMRKTT